MRLVDVAAQPAAERGDVLLHVVAASRQGAAEGLASLGSVVTVTAAGAPTGDGARVTAAVVGFHGLDVAAAGVAVLVLAVLAARGGRGAVGAVGAALVVAAVLDVGLAVFLLLPGLMSAAEGAWGIGLLGVAVVATALTRTRDSAHRLPAPRRRV